MTHPRQSSPWVPPPPGGVRVGGSREAGRNEMEGLTLISPEQLSDCWGLSKSLVYKLIRTKAIPFYRIAKCVRFSPSEVEAWLQERRNVELKMPRKLKRPLDGGIRGQK